MINRLILWLSLAGMILALHLWVQKARGFDQGCWGLDTHATGPVEGGCIDVGVQAASHLFGVSNAAWGYAFYFALALGTFAKLLVLPATARRLHLASEAAVGLGFLYSAWLVYQMAFVVHAWCALCVVSAGLISTLLGAHVGLRMRGGYSPAEEPGRTAEFRAATVAVFATMGVLVGVLLFFDRLGTRSLDAGSTRRELERMISRTISMNIDPKKMEEIRACRFDLDAPTLTGKGLTGATTPFIGPAHGPEVAVFYDPNCSFCMGYHPEFLRLVEKYRDRVRFTVLPHVLWDSSIPAVAALKLAEPSGKYFDVWRILFERRSAQSEPLSIAQIGEVFRELGLDAANLEARLAGARAEVEALRARTKAAGLTGTPALYIGGRKVWAENRSEACVGKLIDGVLAGEIKLPPGP
jgi:uncharacterized membrane protein/thiol-disulfide isomerase/thioredoxin